MSAFSGGNKNAQSTATTNQQVGVSGSGVGISGSYTNSNINIMSSDPETVRAALDSTKAVALQATNYAAQTSIEALQTLNSAQENNAAVIGRVLDANSAIALSAAPRSEGSTIETLAKQQQQTMIAVIAVIGIGALVIFLRK